MLWNRAVIMLLWVTAVVASTVDIPAVKKGISNQRMRIVQDIAAAASLGLAVRLPDSLTSRRSCHYRSECYLDYRRSVDFWAVFDKEATLAALRPLVTVDETPRPSGESVAPLGWPLAHSRLTGARGAVARWIATTSNSSMYLADPRYCCLLLVPDTTRAVTLLARANSALVSSKRTRDHARDVLASYRSRVPRGKTCAVHWRDDDDFVVSEHKLDRERYTQRMVAAIKAVDGDCGGALLLLGDVPTVRLRPLLAAMNGIRIHRLFTKQSLMKSTNWSHEYQGWDDLVGMVDFEIGTLVDVFVGSPFSSFSVLIAVARGDTRGPTTAVTVMPQDIDVDDNLARLFRIQFPYSWSVVATDPCAAVRAISDKLSKRLDKTPNCRFDAPVGMPSHRLTALHLLALVCLALFLCYCRKSATPHQLLDVPPHESPSLSRSASQTSLHPASAYVRKPTFDARAANSSVLPVPASLGSRPSNRTV